jgi:hypothetical protein
MDTEQGPVPVHAPPQPAKAAPADALGVRLTEVPLKKLAEHVAPQLTPAGELVTVPEVAPAPVFDTLSAKVGAGAKSAVTETGAVPMVKVQEPAPEHAPPQPANTEAEEVGDAVRVIVLPVLIALELVQVPVAKPDVMVQLIPPVPVTVPLPVSATALTVTVVRVKVAVTDCAVLIVTVQGTVVPVQAPFQPAKAAPADVLGVRLTEVPLMKLAEQVAPQLMPAGELVTVPEAAPAPVFDTVRAKVGAGAKSAVTETGVVPMVKVQTPVPVQAPLQPENTEAEEAGVAVRVTVLPVLIALELVHVPVAEPDVMVQLMPPVPVIVPLPVSAAALTVTVVRLNVAVTDWAEFMATVQVPVPVHAPLQPEKAEPADALDVRTTDVPLS